MNKKSLSRKKLLKRIAVYGLMVVSVILITLIVSLFTLGYRLNSNDGQIERYSMIQFNSIPSGAKIFIDGTATGLKTPEKATVKAGRHTIVMQLDGYKVWSKAIEIEAGMLDWLNYAILVPESLSVEPVLNFNTVASSISSSDAKYIIAQPDLALADFSLIDVSAKDVKTKNLTIPSTIYSVATPGNVHQFKLHRWSDGSRYVLIEHIYGSKPEWLVMDVEDVSLTKNITAIFDLDISDIWFNGGSGSSFFVLGSGDIRKLEISAGTISRPLVSGVDKFIVYDSKILCYVGTGQILDQKTVGLYRDGDDSSYIIRKYDNSKDSKINVDLTSYYNEYYISISTGKSVEILSGSFPISPQIDSLKVFAFFDFEYDIDKLSFNRSGRHLIAESKVAFMSYDIERKNAIVSSFDDNDERISLEWLDDNYVWTDRSGKLTIREFDGENAHYLNDVAADQAVLLTSNDKYIYSINTVQDGTYQLQRISMRF